MEIRITPVRALVTGLVVALSVALVVALSSGSSDSTSTPVAAKGDAQTVTFQRPDDPGPDPFTEPADVEGTEQVSLPVGADGGEQPFGGSGSNRVCDRDKLIRFLREHPERMREWARVLGIRPRFASVRRYIAKLHPVTLTRDTVVTNHAFKNGRAVPFQAILQAGTAVLVDKYGTPVARCYCGNPLKPAVFTPSAKCTNCPANYKPPRQCRFARRVDYDETYYRRDYYDNESYDEVFIRRVTRSAYSDCYEAYPDPPTVRLVRVFSEPEPDPPPQPAEPSPAAPAQPEEPPRHDEGGLQCDPARSQLEFELCRDMGETQPAEPSPPPEEPHHDGGVNCDAPRSQLEFEQCAGMAPEEPADGHAP